MRGKLVLCLFVFLLAAFGIMTNLHNENFLFKSSLQSIERRSDTTVLAFAPKFQLPFFGFFRLGNRFNPRSGPAKHQATFSVLPLETQMVLRFVCDSLSGFIMFYQIARNNNKQDDPDLSKEVI